MMFGLLFCVSMMYDVCLLFCVSMMYDDVCLLFCVSMMYDVWSSPLC